MAKEYKTHPAYGRAVFSRATGDAGRLFGSPLKSHRTSIRLRISRGTVAHDLGRDRYGTEEELIEVTFSPAQFADLLTNMNVGDGVPCTINYIGHERMPDIPDDELVEHEKIEDTFKADVKETADRLRDGLARLEETLAKPRLTKADKEQITWLIGKALQDVESNAPFMVQQFGEAAEKIVTHAKAEVAAATSAILDNLGREALVQPENRRRIGAVAVHRAD